MNIKRLSLLLMFIVLASFSVEAKVVKFKNGDIYDGEWSNRAPNGHGIMTYANGDKYEGNWVNGKKCGKGLFEYSDGSRYDGYF